MKNADPAFAVVRVDLYLNDDADRVTVKEVVWTLAEAEREVERLATLNADKQSRYFWTPTRVLRAPTPPGSRQ
jgi:hypothetical protein